MYPSRWKMACSRGRIASTLFSSATPPQSVLARSPANMFPELDLVGSVVPTATSP